MKSFNHELFNGLYKKRKITTEKAIKILSQNGINANEEEAKEILDFLYLLAEITLKSYFKDKA